VLVGLIGGLVALGPAVGSGAAAETVTMEARVLLQGHARVGSWMPIEVHIENGGPAIEGELRLSGGAQGSTRYGVAVDQATDSAKTWLLYAQPPAFGHSLTIDLVAGGTKVASADVAFLAHDATQLIVGVVAERPQGIVSQLNLPPSANGSAAVIVPLGPADLPDRVEGWSTLDRLVWQDVDSNLLSSEQLAALRGWLAGGGRLVIAGGTAGIGTVSAFPDDILPYRPTATIDAPPAALTSLIGPAPEGTADLPALAGDLSRGRALATVGDRVVAADAIYGNGSVTIVGFDPTTTWLAESKDVEALWRRLLPTRSSGGPVISGDDSQIVAATQQLPALALPPIGGLLILLGGYILLIGPLNYLVLKRLDRREWAWVTMPALIAIFAVAAYGYGSALRGVDVIVNELSIVRGAPDASEGMAQVYLGVFSPTRGTYQVEVPGGALLSSPISGDIFGTGTGTTMDVLQGDPARVRDLAVGFGQARSLRAESPTTVPRISASLQLKDGILVGTVTNQSQVRLEKVALVLGSSVDVLGDIAPGATVPVSLTPTTLVNGLPLTERILGQSVFSDVGAITDDAERQLIRSSMLNQLTYDPFLGYSGRLDAETPVLLAWGREDVLDVRIEGQTPRRVSNTLFYVPIPMAVSGRTTFANDLVRSTIIESSAMFFSKDPTWLNLGTGTATLAYRPIAYAGSLSVSELAVSMSMSDSIGGGVGKPIVPLPSIPITCTDVGNTQPQGCQPRVQDGLPEVELFDLRGEGTWVRLPHLAAGTRYVVTDPDRYVDETSGTVLVRFVNDQPDMSLSFQFGVAISGDVE
jgi:hypothetical protein